MRRLAALQQSPISRDVFHTKLTKLVAFEAVVFWDHFARSNGIAAASELVAHTDMADTTAGNLCGW